MKQFYTLEDYGILLQSLRMLKEFYSDGKEDSTIEYLTFDSKKVRENTLFVCKGAAFKAQYLDEAIKKGAVAYVSEKKFDTKEDVPYILVDDIRKAMPALAVKFHHSPWEKLHVIGIGGTKGKSTSAYFMKSVVDQYMESIGGKESGILSSIDIYDGVIREESKLTTAEAIELQEHLSNAVKSDISFVEMEVSSQALKYGRVDCMQMEVGIFLNISEDHISPIEHPDFEDYFASKLTMFDKTKYAVVNKDADFSDRILEAAKKCEKVITFSVKDPSADVYGYDLRKDGTETVFRAKTADFDEEFRLGMAGYFNVENALSVIAAAGVFKIPFSCIQKGLYLSHPGGRMEMFVSSDKNKIAIVDFAHNKLSFEKLFSSVREEYPDYRLEAVFGCPGNKAFNRREDMGTVAGKYADKVYLTADDPATEEVKDICGQIAKYVELNHCPYEIVEDRREAIKAALTGTKEKTVFLVTGKGNENWLKYGNSHVPYESDIENVKEFLERTE